MVLNSNLDRRSANGFTFSVRFLRLPAPSICKNTPSFVCANMWDLHTIVGNIFSCHVVPTTIWRSNYHWQLLRLLYSGQS